MDSDGVSYEPNDEQPYETPYSSSQPQTGASYPCAFCGYNLAGTTLGQACPECGNVMSSHPIQGSLGSGHAIASLVLGIISIPSCLLYGVPSLICGPLAIFFGMQAARLIREGRANPSSQGMATAGKICGIVGTCLGGLYFLFWIAVVVLAIGGAALGP